MIGVVFKKEKQEGFYKDQIFTYKDYENAEIGDIVVVDTRYGYAVAMVAALNVQDDRFTEDKLKSVVCVVESKKDRDAKIAKENSIKQLAIAIKREKILNELKSFNLIKDVSLIEEMSYEDLYKFYKIIIDF